MPGHKKVPGQSLWQEKCSCVGGCACMCTCIWFPSFLKIANILCEKKN